MSAFAIDPITVAGEGATRASTATYINSAGKVAVAAANELRFNYDPLDLDAPPVVLVERAPAVNLLSYPRNFDNAAWNQDRIQVLPNVAISPDGTMNADALVLATSGVINSGFAGQNPAVSAGTNYVFSVYLKKGTAPKTVLDFYVNAPYADVVGVVTWGSTPTFVAGTGGGGGVLVDSSFTPAGNGWYRAAISINSGTGTFVTARVYVNDKDTTNVAGQYTYVWHAQVETGSKPSSIIPDATAFVSRGSPKWEFNSAGALAQSAADVAVIAYDPVTLVSRGLSLEAAARNAIRNNTMVGAVTGTPGTIPNNWFVATTPGIARTIVGTGTENGIDYIDIRFNGTATAAATIAVYPEATFGAPAAQGQNWFFSLFVKVVAGSLSGLLFSRTIEERDAAGAFLNLAVQGFTPMGSASPLRVGGTGISKVLSDATTTNITPNIFSNVSSGSVIDITLRIGLPQLEQGTFPTSPIKTTGAAVTRAADISTSPSATRAADVLGTGTLLYSNVPETEYPTYSATGVYGPGERVIYAHEVHQQVPGSSATVTLSIASPCVVTHPAHTFANGQPVKLTTTGALPTGLTAGTTLYVVNQAAGTYQLSATVGGPAINTSGTQSGVHTLTANAIGQTPGPGSLYWTRKSVSNQRMMFDEFNNTASINADVIRVALQPRAVAGGMYLGGIVGADVRVTMVEPNGTMVYSKTISLLRPTTGVSYYNWMFSRIKRTTMAVLSDLPAYYDGVMMVEIRNPGALAACAMLALGPLTDLGFGQYGVSRDITDYSSETFNVDGSSVTVERGYSKGMDLDIVVFNEDIDELTELVESFRQRFLIWIASEAFRLTVVAGKYSTFKTVINDYPTSRMSLSIKGKI